MSRGGNGFTDTSFSFFDDLAANNEREWFHAHKQTFEDYVRTPFIEFLEELGARLTDSPLPVRGGAQTMFRINRDVRFTDDKRPYSENVSGLLTEGGTKSESGRLLYLELHADGGRIGGGMHQAKASELRPVRELIVAEPGRVEELLAALSEAEVEFDRSNQVATMPRGFSDADESPHAELLRCTQLIAMRPLPKSCWLDDTASDRAVEAAERLALLYDFINDARSRH